MFARHYNEMLNDFRQINKGAHIDQLYTGNPTYADDVSIATLHKSVLQYYLNMAYRYSQNGALILIQQNQL